MKCDRARRNFRGHPRRAKAADSEIYFSRVRKPGIRDRKVNAPPRGLITYWKCACVHHVRVARALSTRVRGRACTCPPVVNFLKAHRQNEDEMQRPLKSQFQINVIIALHNTLTVRITYYYREFCYKRIIV